MSQNSSKLPAVASREYRDPAFRPLKEVLERAIATNADPQIIEGIKTVFQYENMREDYTLDCTSQESDTCRKASGLLLLLSLLFCCCFSFSFFGVGGVGRGAEGGSAFAFHFSVVFE